MVRGGLGRDARGCDVLARNALADGGLVRSGRACDVVQRGAWGVRSAVGEGSGLAEGSSREEPSVGVIMGSSRGEGCVTLWVIYNLYYYMKIPLIFII